MPSLCPDSESEIEVVVSANDRTISTTCQIHDSRGFCNLRVRAHRTERSELRVREGRFSAKDDRWSLI